MALTEEQFQQQVLDLARLRGWLTYHTRDSRRSTSGYPDLTLVRGDRLIFAELKKQNAAGATPAQQEWLDALGAAGAETYVWRPSDLRDISAVLS